MSRYVEGRACSPYPPPRAVCSITPRRRPFTNDLRTALGLPTSRPVLRAIVDGLSRAPRPSEKFAALLMTVNTAKSVRSDLAGLHQRDQGVQPLK